MIHLPDEALLRLLCKCAPDQAITSIDHGGRTVAGNWGQQTGDRELGTGTCGQGTWDRELGAGDLGQGTGGRELGQGTGGRELGQGTGNRELGAGKWGHQTGQDLGQGTGDKDLGAGNWGGALLCFKKPEALLCVVESVICWWRRWNHGPEVAEC